MVIKPSNEADGKIQEDCAPGKPYSVFTAENVVNGTPAPTPSKQTSTNKTPISADNSPLPTPVCRYVNVKLCGTMPGCGAKGLEATVLLENPRGEALLNLDELTCEVRHEKLYLILLTFIPCNRIF